MPLNEKAFRAQRCLAAALVVMLLLAGSSPATAVAGVPAKPAAPSTHAPTGKLTSILIVAQDAVSDPNFAGSIVLVMNDLGPAPVGLIINRPMPLPVARFFPQLKRLAGVLESVYYGGPVEFGTGTVWYLFRAGSAPATAIQV